MNTPKWLRAWPTWVRLKTRSKTQGPVLQKSCLRILTKLMKSRWLSQLGAVLDNRGRNRDAPYRKMTGHDIKIIQIQHQWLSIEKTSNAQPNSGFNTGVPGKPASTWRGCIWQCELLTTDLNSVMISRLYISLHASALADRLVMVSYG